GLSRMAAELAHCVRGGVKGNASASGHNVALLFRGSSLAGVGDELPEVSGTVHCLGISVPGDVEPCGVSAGRPCDRGRDGSEGGSANVAAGFEMAAAGGE